MAVALEVMEEASEVMEVALGVTTMEEVMTQDYQ